MKFLILISLLNFEKSLFTSELNKNFSSYPSDYTSGNLTKIVENINIDEHKYYQKVVLDHDNVYRLKTFKKKLSATPRILKNIINLEANLAILNRSKFANKKRNITNSL